MKDDTMMILAGVLLPLSMALHSIHVSKQSRSFVIPSAHHKKIEDFTPHSVSGNGTRYPAVTHYEMLLRNGTYARNSAAVVKAQNDLLLAVKHDRELGDDQVTDADKARLVKGLELELHRHLNADDYSWSEWVDREQRIRSSKRLHFIGVDIDDWQAHSLEDLLDWEKGMLDSRKKYGFPLAIPLRDMTYHQIMVLEQEHALKAKKRKH